MHPCWLSKSTGITASTGWVIINCPKGPKRSPKHPKTFKTIQNGPKTWNKNIQKPPINYPTHHRNIANLTKPKHFRETKQKHTQLSAPKLKAKHLSSWTMSPQRSPDLEAQCARVVRGVWPLRLKAEEILQNGLLSLFKCLFKYNLLFFGEIIFEWIPQTFIRHPPSLQQVIPVNLQKPPNQVSNVASHRLTVSIRQDPDFVDGREDTLHCTHLGVL